MEPSQPKKDVKWHLAGDLAEFTPHGTGVLGKPTRARHEKGRPLAPPLPQAVEEDVKNIYSNVVDARFESFFLPSSSCSSLLFPHARFLLGGGGGRIGLFCLGVGFLFGTNFLQRAQPRTHVFFENCLSRSTRRAS